MGEESPNTQLFN